MQQPARQPLDRGYIKVVCGQYHKKQNGQLLYDNNNQPVVGYRYTTIGEVTRWPSDNGGHFDRLEFYPGFTILDSNKDGLISWDSQNQQRQPPAQQAPAAQPAASTSGYQQIPQR